MINISELPFRKVFILLILLVSVSVNGQTKLASVFGDHMVLQRNTEVAIWGTDKPNAKMTITSEWGEEVSAKCNKAGEWKVKLKTVDAGGPYTIQIQGSEKVVLQDVLLGEVWLCSGQSNMEMPLKGNAGQPVFGSNEAILNSSNSNLRLFKVGRKISTTPLKNCEGQWAHSNPQTSRDFSAVAYFYGSLLQKQLGIPVGLINSSWGGTPAEAWTPEETIEEGFENYAKVMDDTSKLKHRTPTVLYNGMINPLVPFTIKGSIWYQGEGNRFYAKEYETLFPAMINSWRDRFEVGEFPFYFVQIASFGYAKEDWVELQQSQLKTMLTVPNTGMAVTVDVGNETCIHPPQKKEVGERLALWALAKDYGIKGIQYSGPVYKSKKIADGKIFLDFDYAPQGVTDMYKGLSAFEIAGDNGVYVQAEAKIKKGKLEVWSKEVPNPKHVRYGWKGYFDACLFNVAGLPASSFSTENMDKFFKEVK